MDMLFRPVFARVKTPVMGSTPGQQSSTSTDDNDEPEEILTTNIRVRTTPRIPSYMGFEPATPPIPSESFHNVRNPEDVYHKPSSDQLAEMLKVVMMNQSNTEPVPIEYNSTILHVLEAYHDLRMQLTAEEDAMEMLKQSSKKDIKDFEELASQWHQKEGDYKIEMKKLEVLLSKTEGGMESVALARSKSVIHGATKASASIKRGIGTIKHRNSARNSHQTVQAAKISMQGSVHGIQTLTKVQLKALERQQAQEFGVNFESSVSGADSSSVSHHSDIPPQRTPLLGLGIHEKPLPEIPISANERAKQTTLDKYLSSRQHSYSDPNTPTPVKQSVDYEKVFSFRPGDDDELVGRRSSDRDRAQRSAVDEHLGYRPSMPNLKTGPITPTSDRKTTSHRPRLARLEDKKTFVSPKPSQLPRIQDNDHILGRMDSSSSSIVTAVRDNSGRSSASNSQAGRPKLKRNTWKQRSDYCCDGGGKSLCCE
ncbi:hypothetical protein D0Z07_6211 [Hyphodiscus hymeniophilus]|uniref:Uncharacterized protein n=1 Tax=Hyphodiscus hymeniophilus TaxID=353542 RepID=A0A9P7AUE6_9HELO|nr:hypothetical protein D0Z07_6211 [Hyphodiscus hymeniophilus]